jgi:hypothetical protein
MMTAPTMNMMELWGRTLLSMARFLEGSPGLLQLFHNSRSHGASGADSPLEEFMHAFPKIFGKEGIERFNTLFEEFYLNVGVVPRARYNELHEKYMALQEKMIALEKSCRRLESERPAELTGDPFQLISSWARTARNFAEFNTSFFEEVRKLQGRS